jgi:Uncharacterized protein conserved in bacteria (DUF2184)
MRFAQRQSDINRRLEEDGIIFMDGRQIEVRNGKMVYAQDAAQPLSVTAQSSGIPWYLLSQIDPKQIEIVLAPTNATKIMPEEKKGDWTDEFWKWAINEASGEVAAYGDHNTSGEANSQTTWVTRQNYYYQTMTTWGERETAIAAKAKIALPARKEAASLMTMNKFQNKTYFFGFQGLENYGLLNDPNLLPSLTPLPYSGTDYTWASKIAASTNDGTLAIFADIQQAVTQLIAQTYGYVTAQSKMKLCLSPSRAGYLNQTNTFGLNVMNMISKNYPGMTVEVAVEFESQVNGIGELMYLIADELDGQETLICAFNEKMRAHAIVIETSSFKQKKSGGTWGAIIEQPLGIVVTVGI